jgi:hypothetical protein
MLLPYGEATNDYSSQPLSKSEPRLDNVLFGEVTMIFIPLQESTISFSFLLREKQIKSRHVAPINPI